MNDHLRFLTIGIITALLAGGVFVWMLFFNVGRVEVTGADGATVTVEGSAIPTARTATCEAGVACAVKVPPGRYSVRVTQEGYVEEILSTEVKRGQTATLAVTLTLIPVLQEVATLTPSDAAFTDVAGVATGVAFSFDPTYRKYKLGIGDRVWAYFEQDFSDAAVFAHPAKRLAIFMDGSLVYGVDGDAGRRWLVGEMEGVRFAEWDPDSSVVALYGESGVIVVDVLEEDGEADLTTPLGVTLPAAGVWMRSSKLVFATVQGPVATSALNALIQSSDTVAFSLFEYDATTKSTRRLIDVPTSLGLTGGITALRLGVNPANGTAIFTDGVKVFEVVR